MIRDLEVPASGESIETVELVEWKVREGDPVEADQIVFVIESDKATLEVPAPTAGRLIERLYEEGDEISVGEVVARIEEGEGEPTNEDRGTQEDDGKTNAKPSTDDPRKPAKEEGDERTESREEEAGPERHPARHEKTKPESRSRSRPASPSARRALRERGDRDSPTELPGAGPITRREVDRAFADEGQKDEPRPAKKGERRERMSRLRRTIAERLVEAQRRAALLTTFQEIEMTRVIEWRKEWGETFEKRHGVRLGFLPFFVRAVVLALRDFPRLNAWIDGEEIVHPPSIDIGIAIGTDRGLIVPVLFEAETLDLAAIERRIEELAQRAEQGELTLDELQGGTFTITNGGVYGSLLSTPIVDPPQSGVLGMHAIEARPVVRDGEIVVREMMYVALTYDHRLVDGREAVSFLRRVKLFLERPERMWLDL